IDSSTVQSTGGKLDLEADSKAGIIAVTVGVAGSGAVAVNATGFGNVIANTIDASIRDGSRVTTSSLVKQNATDQSDIRSLGISVAGTGAVAAGALIGANVISNTVSAEISGSTVMSGSTLDLSAQEESTILGFTTGVAASGAGAGLLSLTANVITNTTEAGIVDETIGQTDTHSTVQAAGSVTISAQDTSSIDAIAIGVSGTGGGAIGLAVAGNVIANKIQTFITGSTLSSTNSTISMSSVSSAVIRSLAIGVSGSGLFAVQLTVMGNSITDTVTSLISSSTVTAAGDITVTAQDIAPSVIPGLAVSLNSLQTSQPSSSQQESVSGALGSLFDPTANILALMVSVAGTGGVAVNGAFSGNDISNTIEADVINASSVISRSGELDLEAQSSAGIIAATIGVAGSGGVAVNATGFGNVIANTIDASVKDGSRVITGGLVNQSATDQSEIRSLGISVAGTGGVAVGALIGANVITNTVSAEISGSTVTSGSTLDLSAQEEATILGLTMGVAGSGAGAGLLSLSANVIADTVKAGIMDETIAHSDTGSAVKTAGAVTISAEDSSTIDAIAFGVSGSGGAAIGAALSANVITNKIETFITGSTLGTGSSPVSSLSMTAESSAVIRSVTLGVSGSGGFALQVTGVGNIIADTITSIISNSTVNAKNAITVTATDSNPGTPNELETS